MPGSFPALQKLSVKMDGGISECEFLILILIKDVPISGRSHWIPHQIIFPKRSIDGFVETYE